MYIEKKFTPDYIFFNQACVIERKVIFWVVLGHAKLTKYLRVREKCHQPLLLITKMVCTLPVHSFVGNVS